MPIIFKSNAENKTILFYDVDKNAPVCVYDIGFHATEPKHSYGPANRPYFLLHFIEKGKGYVDRKGEVTHLKAGDCFIIHPGEITTYTADATEPWQYCWISFYGDYAQSLMQQTTTKNYVKYQNEGLWALKNAIDKHTEDNVGLLRLLFTVLDSIKEHAKESKPDFVKAAKTYIENNYFRNFNISSLCKTLHVSRAHFTTVYMEKTGETPYNYLLKIRLQHAEEYLQNTTMSIEEIAYAVGFSSIERFSSTFKHVKGIPPLAFRHSSKLL